LKKVHNLSERERCWLECAALLHDVGLSKGTSKHNKNSAKIILFDSQLPFTSTERQIIASITRYHRKGLPKNKHYNLATLDAMTIQTVKVLASLLRLADALDYSHSSNVRKIDFKADKKKVTVECIATTQSLSEEQAFDKKKDLFEMSLRRKLVLKWKVQ
jgi:exopolyphosphatase/guanosine-5'-triphosphate,3'-diphosphate pyrophosphatase